MEFSDNTTQVANRLRRHTQNATETISQGEAAAITLWWSFILDHAEAMGHDPHALAKSQLEAFLSDNPINLVRQH